MKQYIDIKMFILALALSIGVAFIIHRLSDLSFLMSWGISIFSILINGIIVAFLESGTDE